MLKLETVHSPAFLGCIRNSFVEYQFRESRFRSTHPCGVKLNLESPPPIRFASFAAPAPRVFSDVAEGLTDRCTVGKFPLLHDFFAKPTPNQFRADAIVR